MSSGWELSVTYILNTMTLMGTMRFIGASRKYREHDQAKAMRLVFCGILFFGVAFLFFNIWNGVRLIKLGPGADALQLLPGTCVDTCHTFCGGSAFVCIHAFKIRRVHNSADGYIYFL